MYTYIYIYIYIHIRTVYYDMSCPVTRACRCRATSRWRRARHLLDASNLSNHSNRECTTIICYKPSIQTNKPKVLSKDGFSDLGFGFEMLGLQGLGFACLGLFEPGEAACRPTQVMHIRLIVYIYIYIYRERERET